MFYCTTNGQYIQENRQFNIDGITYPPQWLNQSTPEQKTALGLEEVVAVNSPANPEYYWVSEILSKATLTYLNTSKDLDQVKESAVSKVKQVVYSILQPTDYIDIRNIRDPMYKPELISWRDSIRVTASESIAKINKCNSVDDVEKTVNGITWLAMPEV